MILTQCVINQNINTEYLYLLANFNCASYCYYEVDIGKPADVFSVNEEEFRPFLYLERGETSSPKLYVFERLIKAGDVCTSTKSRSSSDGNL